MPGSRLYNFTLGQPQFEVTPFQAVAFEPKEKEDMSLLADSFAKIEQRRNAYNEKRATLNSLLGSYQDKFQWTHEQREWFDNFQKKYDDQIRSYLSTGDISGAMNEAVRLAGEAARDKELSARLKSSESYQNYMKEIDNRIGSKVTQEEGNWWKEKYGNYYFSPETDEEGNVIYANDYKPMRLLYDSFNPAAHAQLALQMLNPDTKSSSTSRSSGTSFSKDGTGSSQSSSRGSGLSKTVVTKEEIREQARELINASADTPESIYQRFEYEKDRYTQLYQELEDMKSADPSVVNTDAYKNKLYHLKQVSKNVLTSDGVIGELEDFYANVVYNEIYEKGLAYSKIDTNSSSSNNSSRTVNTDPTGAGAAVAQQKAIDDYRNTNSGANSDNMDRGSNVVKQQKGDGSMLRVDTDKTNNLFIINPNPNP